MDYMSTDNLQSVALFPIPECVVFPGMVFPLHVFEPRYRNMIRHCIRESIPVAICHTQKTLHEVEPAKSKEEALSKNQDTFKPYPIFSAGRCELVSTTDDGRLLVNVYIDRRLEFVEEEQTLPFVIAKCKPLLDQIMSDENATQAELLKDKIIHRLIALSGGDEDLSNKLNSDLWQKKTPQAFSFKVFSLIRLHADVQQSILENRNPLVRLNTILKVLNNE